MSDAIPKVEQDGQSLRSEIADTASEARQWATSEGQVQLDRAKIALRDAVDDRKNELAAKVEAVAASLRAAAECLSDEDVETAAGYVRRVADQVDEFGSSFRSKELADLIGDVDRFARRRPEIFLGLSVVAGLALGRFARSSNQRRATATPSVTGQRSEPSAKRRSNERSPSPSERTESKRKETDDGSE